MWRIHAEDNLLWKDKCEKAGLLYCLNSKNEDMLQRLSKKTSFVYSFWKASFLKPYRIEKNFRTKRPQVTNVQKCHFVEGEHLRLSVLNNVIVSSSNYAMYVSCALTGKTLHTLAGHTDKVVAIQMANGFVVSGSWDKTVIVWDVNTGECIHVLRGHTSPVLCLHMHAGIAVSGSYDSTLQMWNVQEGQLLRTLEVHARGVSCVQYNGNLLVSGGFDGRVKVWDAETGECLRTLTGPGTIYSLKVDGDLVLLGSLHTIKIWNVNTGVVQKTLFNYWGSNCEVQGNALVGFDRLESKYKIWNILTNNCLGTLDSHDIAGFKFNDKFVVTTTGQFDGKVKLWDVKTGEFIRDVCRLKSGGKVVKIWMEETKIVCAVQALRLDNLKKIDIFVLNC